MPASERSNPGAEDSWPPKVRRAGRAAFASITGGSSLRTSRTPGISTVSSTTRVHVGRRLPSVFIVAPSLRAVPGHTPSDTVAHAITVLHPVPIVLVPRDRVASEGGSNTSPQPPPRVGGGATCRCVRRCLRRGGVAKCHGGGGGER